MLNASLQTLRFQVDLMAAFRAFIFSTIFLAIAKFAAFELSEVVHFFPKASNFRAVNF
jgi:hypothetical protein